MRRKVGELLSKSIVGVGPDEMLSTAIEIMRVDNISCIPVLAAGKPIGIVTERTMVGLLANAGSRFLDKPLVEIMNTPVISVNAEVYLYEALHILVNKQIRHLIITDDDGKAIGVITLSDIVNVVGNEFLAELQTVEQFMSTSVFTVPQHVSLREVLLEMSTRLISCVIVSEDDRPIGMLTERDVVRLAAAGKNLEEILVSEVMCTPVILAQSSSQVTEVTNTLREKGIRRVVIVNDEGCIEGLVTQTNIMRGLEASYISILKQVIKEKDTRIESTSRQLSDLSQYLLTIMNNSIDMAIVAVDQNFRVVYFNSCAEEILDCPADKAIGRRVDDIHQQRGVKTTRFDLIIAEVRQKGAHEFSFDREEKGKMRHFLARISAIRSTTGTALLGYVLIVQDNTERKRAEENIRYMAYHDILTGLPNRTAFNERFELELAHAQRKHEQLAVMVIDIDRFKEVNDNHGHYSGDLLLTIAASRLQGSLRKSDTIARVGGDEFMVVLPDIKHDEDATTIAKKLLFSMVPMIRIKEVELSVNISLGIACYPCHGTDAHHLIIRADQAMYIAKDKGKINGISNLSIYKEEALLPFDS